MIQPFQEKLQAFYHITHSFVSEYNLNRVLQLMASEVLNLSHYDLISIYLLQGDQLNLKSNEGKVPNLDVIKTIPFKGSFIGQALQKKETILIHDFTSESSYYQELKLTLGSIYLVPLIMNKQPIGILLVGSQEPHAFHSDDLQFINILASSTTMAINNAINYNILRTFGRIATLTAKKSGDILNSYPQLIEELLTVIPFDGLIISIPHPFLHGEVISFRIYSDNKILPLDKQVAPYKDSATEKVLVTKKRVMSKGKGPYKTILRFPVLMNDEAIGVIHIYNKRNNAYNRWELDTISQLLQQIAPAIENIVEMVYKAELNKINMLANKLSSSLNYSQEIEQTLSRFLNTTKRFLNYSDTAFWLLDQERLTLRMLNTRQITELPITDDSIITRSFLNKQTSILHDINYSKIHPNLPDSEIKSSFIIPLCDENENQCVGIFVIHDTSEMVRFNDEAIQVANQYVRPLGTHILKHFRKLQLEKANMMMIQTLTVALDKKDAETKGHSSRVMTYSLAIAKRLAVRENLIEKIKWGALLHDIGKIGIPDAILLKPDKLSEDEWNVMRKHPLIGYEMIQAIEFLEGAIDVVLYHHERFDGKGYPYGLKEKEIPLPARIFAIADAFDAITSRRPYKDPQTIETARKIIEEDTGTHFCPYCAEAFLSIPPEELLEIQLSYDEKALFT